MAHDPEIQQHADMASTEPLSAAEEAVRESVEQQPLGFVVNDRRFWQLSEEELAKEEERPKLPTYVEQLRAQVEEKDRQLREYIQAYKKEVGDGLEKTRQRLARDAAAQAERLRGEIASPMLDVLDALERSVAAADPSGDGRVNVEALLQGVQMVHMLMIRKLQEIGLTRIDAVGQPFDPARHEAVAVLRVADPAHDNVVVHELRPGFVLGDRVIRPAQVQVAKRVG